MAIKKLTPRSGPKPERDCTIEELYERRLREGEGGITVARYNGRWQVNLRRLTRGYSVFSVHVGQEGEPLESVMRHALVNTLEGRVYWTCPDPALAPNGLRKIRPPPSQPLKPKRLIRKKP